MNATMDVRSYEAGQHKKLKNKGVKASGGKIAKQVQESRLKGYKKVVLKRQR